ncbi:hypothetical protein [Robinsoniella peoriensis]
MTLEEVLLTVKEPDEGGMKILIKSFDSFEQLQEKVGQYCKAAA